MLVKVSKKVLLVLAVVMLLGSTALPESVASPLVGTQEAPPPAAPASPLISGQVEDANLTQTLPGGITVTYTGLWKHGNTLEASYTVVSNRTRRVAIDGDNSNLIDANGVHILPSDRRIISGWNHRVFSEDITVEERAWESGRQQIEAGVHTNGEKQDVTEFTANQPYDVMVRYWVPATYVLTPTFKSITVVVNGLPVTFEEITAFP